MGCTASIEIADRERIAANGPGPFPSVTASAGFASRGKADHTGRPNEDRALHEQVRRGVYLFSVVDGHKVSLQPVPLTVLYYERYGL